MRLSLLLGALGVLVAACSGADKEGESSSSSSGENASSSSGFAGASSSGGENTSSSGGASGGMASGGVTSSGGSSGPGLDPQTCPHTADEQGFFSLQSGSGDYFVRLPVGYDGSRAAPLFVALKGCFDNAQNFATWAGAPYDVRATQDYVAISVGGRDGECWTAADTALVNAAITHVQTCFAIDPKKIVIGGYDAGGLLAFRMGFAEANRFAGLLVEHASLSAAVGAGKVDETLNAAAWKLNVAIVAGRQDEYYGIDVVRADVGKMQTAGFPVQLEETDDAHGGETRDWVSLIGKSRGWTTP